MENYKDEVSVGKTINIEVVGYIPEPENFYTQLRRRFPKLGQFTPEQRKYCNFNNEWSTLFNWFTDIGTIEPGANPGLYQVPPKKPTPNVATVSLTNFRFSVPAKQKEGGSFLESRLATELIKSPQMFSANYLP
ncbi:MAG: hypothetical protein ABI954_01530 [Pyrinomonadaceae bacterium]